MEWEIQFSGMKIKEKQEEFMSAISDLYNALKEYEAESGYLQSIWKGPAADMFFDRQKSIWIKIGECTEKTQQLMLALIEAEEVFAQGEKEVCKILEEKCIWEI